MSMALALAGHKGQAHNLSHQLLCKAAQTSWWLSWFSSMCAVHICNTHAALTHLHLLFPLQATFQPPSLQSFLLWSLPLFYFTLRGICCLAPSCWPFNIQMHTRAGRCALPSSGFPLRHVEGHGAPSAMQPNIGWFKRELDPSWLREHEKLIWESKMLYHFYVYVTLWRSLEGLLAHFHV